MKTRMMLPILALIVVGISLPILADDDGKKDDDAEGREHDDARKKDDDDHVSQKTNRATRPTQRA